MYRHAMQKLEITRFKFRAAPALRIVNQLNRGSITMAMVSAEMLPHINDNLTCSESFTQSVIRRYTLTSPPVDQTPHYGYAIPNEVTAYLDWVVPENTQYQAVHASLLPELLTSGRYRYVIDFEARVEPLLKASGINYQSTVLSNNSVHVCIQKDFPDSEKVMTVTAEVLGEFRYTDHGKATFLAHGIDPETNLPIRPTRNPAGSDQSLEF